MGQILRAQGDHGFSAALKILRVGGRLIWPHTRRVERLAWIASASLGFLAVLLGAFGAHGLRPIFARAEDAAKRMEWWQTASHYHLAHALALGLVAVLLTRNSDRALHVSVFAFVAGVLLFSGSLYTMAVTGMRALAALTPIGGVCFLVGWASLLVAAVRLARS